MMKRIAVLVLIMVMTLATPALAAGEGNGTIQGTIVNQTVTEKAGSIADLTIMLKTLKNDAEIGQTTTKTDDQGNFSFTGLLTDSVYTYQLSLTYQGASYDQIDPVTFSGNTTAQTVDVSVWNSTSDENVVWVNTEHTVITPEEGNLQVLQYYVFVNDSDLTYIGQRPITQTDTVETLYFNIPQGATDLQYDGLMSCCVTDTSEGLADTMVVFPGQKEVKLQYTLPAKSDRYNYDQKVYLYTGSYNLFVLGQTVKLSSNQLAVQEPITAQNQVYQYLYGENLEKGQTLTMSLAGLPKGGSQRTMLMWTGAGVLLLAIGFMVTNRLIRRRPAPERVPINDNDELRQQLLVELAQLDDDFENGSIPEEVYQKQRTEKKAQIIRLTSKSRGNE